MHDFFMEEGGNIQMILKNTVFFLIVLSMTFIPNYVFFREIYCNGWYE